MTARWVVGRSVDVWNILRWLNRGRIVVPARRSALPRLCGFYLIWRAANAITPDNFFSKAVDALSDDGSAPLAFNAAGRICVEVTLIGALSPAIAVMLILTIRNLGTGHAPTE